MLTAQVMKYAGGLTKCYAVSISIIICTFVSSLFGIQNLTPQIVVGCIMVIFSVFLYASKPRSRTLDVQQKAILPKYSFDRSCESWT